ncbi:MAG: NAD(P)H-hydrate dehydratase [Planctomycetota bacterium]
MTETPVRLPVRDRDTHKGNYGRVALVGGSRGMAGAIALSGLAASKAGSGLVTICVPNNCQPTVANFHPGVMTRGWPDNRLGSFHHHAANQCSVLRGFDAIGIGPGLTTDLGPAFLLASILELPVPVILDADAINLIATREDLADRAQVRQQATILTPHPGEWSRISKTPARDREQQIQSAEDWAGKSGCVVVLKGAETIVTDGERTWKNQTGTPAMATGGSGDVLTGIITSLVGQGLSAWDAARLAAQVHGMAGEAAEVRLGAAAVTARELVDELRVESGNLTP